jgi:hypothetical protein
MPDIPFERFKQSDPISDMDRLYLLAVDDAKQVRQDFIRGEEVITARVGDLIDRYPNGQDLNYSRQTKLIRFPIFDQYTDDGLTLGIKLMQLFMPGEPYQIRQNRITTYTLRSSGKPNEQILGEIASFDFLTESVLIQSEDADQALEVIEDGQWVYRQRDFLRRLDLVDKTLTDGTL